MARAWNRLTANSVRGANKRGRYTDGGGLYLQVAKGGTRAWTFLFTRNGLSRAMGLGSARSVSLALARELAADAREKLARGIDPVDARQAAAQAQKAARARLATFKQCAEEYHELNRARWVNEKDRREWMSAVSRYAYPILGDLAVDSIDSGHVCKVLLPLATAKPVTAARLRGRVEAVLAFAKAAGRRTGENPAEKSIIGNILPLRSEKANVTHLPALPFAKVPEFMQALRATEGTTARLLELSILVAMRATAIRLARFDEFELREAAWTVPSSRMKALKRDHRIPLCARAVEIVRELRDKADGDFVFGGAHPVGKNEVGKLLPKLLKAIGYTQHVVQHGFRSSFTDWAHETRDYPTEVVEQALGHRIRSNVERAYRRGDLFERRKHLMADWGAHVCGGKETFVEVVKLRA